MIKMKKVIIVLFGISALSSCRKKEVVVACVTADKSEILTNEVVQFTNCSENYLTAEWDFGDGNESEIGNKSHRYTKSGEYIVRLRVLDEEGNASEASTSVKVHDVKLSKITIDHPDLQQPDFFWNMTYNYANLFNNNQIEIDTISNNKLEFNFKNPQHIFDQDVSFQAIKYESTWWSWEPAFTSDILINAYDEIDVNNLSITKTDQENELTVTFDYELDL